MKRKTPPFFLLVLLTFIVLSYFSLNVKASWSDYVFPIGDAKTWRLHNSTNFGDSPTSTLGNRSYLGASYQNDESIGFYKFDMADFDPTLSGYESISYTGFDFELYSDFYYDWVMGENFFTLAYSENQTWGELNITWLDYPSFTETGEDVEVNDDGRFFTWSLSEISLDVLNAIENDQNFTVVITFNGFETQGFACRMREYGGVSFDPRIVLYYDIVTGDRPVYERDVVLANFPYMLGEKLGIGAFGGQLLASVIFIFAFILPVSYYAKEQPLPYIIIGFAIMGFLVGIGWLPVWILLVVSLLLALMYSSAIRGWIKGRV